MKDRLLPQKRITGIGLAFVLTGFVVSAGIARNFNKDVVRIAGEAFIKNNTIRIIRMLSDGIGPRVTGSASAHKAALLCLDLFKKYGLSNVHLEFFQYKGWLPGIASAEAVKPYHKSLRVESMARSINTNPEGLIAEVIDVGGGTEGDFEKKREVLVNKIVLAGAGGLSGQIKAASPLEVIAHAAEYGASGCIIISSTKGAIPKIRRATNEVCSRIPAAAITREDGTWIRRLSEAGKTVKIKLIIQNKINSDLQTENVVAEIAGSEKPEEIVLVGAHLDSWSTGTGAADNALGCSIAMESARIINALPEKPRRSIRFVLFTGEEEGLFGSWEYVKRHEQELDRIVLMVNLDMTGLMYPGFLNPYGGCQFEEELKPLLKLLEGFGVTHIERKYPYDSDDFNFIARGVPGLGLLGRGIRDWNWAHSYGDTFEKIEIDKVNMTTSAIGIIVHYAANKEGIFAERLSEEDVIRFFQKKNLVKRLKQEGAWKKLGFPDNID
jgi:hypothetical protein